MLEPGAAFALVVNGVLVAAVVATALVWVAFRGTGSQADETDAVETWCEEAMALTRDVREVAEHADGADADELRRQIVPLSARLQSHARAAPQGVDAGRMRELHALGTRCYAVGMEHTLTEAARTGEFLEHKLERIATSAAAFEAGVAAR